MNKIVSFVFAAFLLAGCAGQRPPEGGPLDTTPPEIISVYPPPNTVHYDDDKIVIEFSEYVDRRSVEEAIFISPAIENIEFNWSGTEVEVIFPDPLRKNTTYVVTVGTDVVDYRNRNKMAKAVTLSFSTGATIDKGAITGRIYDESPQGVMIFSYRKNEINADTLNPTFTKPDYITQAGSDGSFALTNLASGTYRLFAVKDEYRNLLYDPETDAAGTADDVVLTEKDTLKTNIKFILAREDTTPPRIASVTAFDQRHLLVQFSEEMDSSSVSASRFFISDTNYREALSVLGIFANITPVNSYTVVTGAQSADSLYVLTVDSVKDRAGHGINPLARQKQFKGSPVVDSLPASLVTSTIGVLAGRILPDRPIEFRYNDEVLILDTDSLLVLKRSRDSSLVGIEVRKNSPSSVTATPRKSLQIDERYFFTFHYRFLSDRTGNSYRDSTETVEFVVDDPERYGSIEGDFAGLRGTAPKVVQAVNLKDKKQPPAKTVVNERGKFMFTMLPEGQYALKVFDDRNGNNAHDAGRVFPYITSEKFILGKDTIRVRPRWPVDGVFIKE